ncbi:MAG TPA: 50S ribosomal protein L23 [Chthonomonadales bacterium]|nr:50S ribosomal protein L23 [Chthonomonadales bacterium]
MKDVYTIIERPLLTEKSMDQSHRGKYTFRVARDANKIEIAEAIERIYRVSVVKVNTMTVKGKKRRVGRFPEGRTSDWKKAIVTLKPGQSITVFEGL